MPSAARIHFVAAAVALLLAGAVAALAVGDGPLSMGLSVNAGGNSLEDTQASASQADGDETRPAADDTTTSTPSSGSNPRPGATTTSGAVGVGPVTPTVPSRPTVPPVATRRRNDAPMGCDKVDAAVAGARSRRRAAALAADQSSRADRLGEYLLISEPRSNSTPGYSGRVTREDMAQGSYLAWESGAMFDEAGYRAGYHRNWTWDGSWSHNDGGGALVLYVYEFADADAALAFEAESIHRLCQETVEVFDTPGVSGGIGVSFRNMTGAPVAERVSFVRGPRYYVVAHEVADQPPTYEVLEFAADEAAIAR